MDIEFWQNWPVKLLDLVELFWLLIQLGFPGGTGSKESACSVRDPGLIRGLGRCPGEGNGNPLQHLCLENSTDWGASQDTVLGVAKSWARSTWSTWLSFFLSISLLVIGLLRLSISSWFSLGRLYVSTYLSFSSRLSNLLAYNGS